MTYTISQGNDRNLFGINSTSGELLLVAPLTVTANDIIVLVVSVVDILSTNSSFQDTAVVKMTFQGKQNYTPNANMADHSVVARDELHESEVSQS